MQRQVGSRWHQDHEAYFTLVINLTDSSNPNSSTKFCRLEPNEKYNWDDAGNPVLREHWKESYVKPFHLCILNSGIRYFLFPFNQCRPIVHRGPALEHHNKRLAVLATFSISGIKQGMDLKAAYIPLLNESTPARQNSTTLQNLRKHWRNILGIEKSILVKNFTRRSKIRRGINDINSIKFTNMKFLK